MEMTPERWQAANRYTRVLFGPDDEFLSGLVRDAAAAGLPDIAVSHDVGRLLMILTSMTPGRLAIEVGTLGGYSGTWISRGLSPGGRLITIEADQRHADFARGHFAEEGLQDTIEVCHGPGSEILTELASDLGDGSVDVGFVDANKDGYPEYFAKLRPMIAPGGLFIADNVLGSANRWVDDLTDPQMAATDEMTRVVVADPDFDSAVLSVREGVLVARRRA